MTIYLGIFLTLPGLGFLRCRRTGGSHRPAAYISRLRWDMRLIFGRVMYFIKINCFALLICCLDNVFINYSWEMTPCHLVVKQGQNILNIGASTNFGSSNSNMTSNFEIDDVSIINYAWDDGTLPLWLSNNSPVNLRNMAEP